MPLKRFSKRRVSRFTPGRRRSVPYTKFGQQLPTFTRSRNVPRLLHIFPAVSIQQSMGASSNNPLGAGTNALILNEVPRAAGVASRTGTKIKMRTLLINYEWHMGNTAGVTPQLHQHLKMVLLYDRRPIWGAAAYPSWTDVYESSAFTSFRTMMSRDRFEVLLEKDVALNAEPTYNGTSIVPIEGPRSFARGSLRVPINRLTSWAPDDTSGVLAAMTYGSLFLVGLSNGPYVANSSPYCFFSYKLSFDDLNV